MRSLRAIQIFAFVLLFSFSVDSINQVFAQEDSEMRVAVIDMQEVLNEYFKTKIQVEKLNALVDRRQKKIEELGEVLKPKVVELGELRKKMGDEALSKESRKKVAEEFEALVKEASVIEKERLYRSQKASVEITTARSEMEKILLAEIKIEMKAVIESHGIDLVFDKSFLPKANKAIMNTSERVNDLSKKVIDSLNAKAP